MKAVIFFLITTLAMASTALADNQSLGSCSKHFPGVQAYLSLTGKPGEIFVNATKLPIGGPKSFYFEHTGGNEFKSGTSTIRLTHNGGSGYTATLSTTMGTIDLNCNLDQSAMDNKVLVATRELWDRSAPVVAEKREAKYVVADETPAAEKNMPIWDLKID